MERAIGEAFDFDGIKLQVKGTGYSCSCWGCYLTNPKHIYEGVRFINQTGECFPFFRTDGKNVIFVEVENDQNKEKLL